MLCSYSRNARAFSTQERFTPIEEQHENAKLEAKANESQI